VSFLDRFFNRKKKENQFDVEFFTKDVPLSTIARWYIYDTELAEPNEVADLLGMTYVSEEGNEKERQDSDNRLEAINYLLPYINMISDISSDVITSIQVSEITKKNPDDKEEIEREINTMATLYKVIGMAAVVGAFSTAMDLGLIKPGDVSGTDLGWKDFNEGDDSDE
jgi:hypothetical protein